jgi:peptide-methionine (S)-S-oxide reductase
MERATFAAGCFWGVEAEFRKLRGVVSTTVGYTGGDFRDPTYFDVCTGVTGHAESVQIEFDPAQISYEQLLDVFWNIHDPSSGNRQGADVGSQYRSAIFFHTPEQEAAARLSKDLLDTSGKYTRPVTTQIVPATAFYPAEEYHQRYFEKHAVASCRA